MKQCQENSRREVEGQGARQSCNPGHTLPIAPAEDHGSDAASHPTGNGHQGNGKAGARVLEEPVTDADQGIASPNGSQEPEALNRPRSAPQSSGDVIVGSCRRQTSIPVDPSAQRSNGTHLTIAMNVSLK